ncbi:MAG: hypothetical protein AOA65_0923 [Candidatus Bathyarchaeota archaeon BA1]|nr:MAG: hypothetical protein AOA65_0923 [Candidatus Bathyarchaeota archaeon BA1]
MESLKQRIEGLSRELSPLKEERGNLTLEARRWAEKRNSIHEQIKGLRMETADLRRKRNALNERVRELKDLREQARAERKEKRAQVSKLREKMGNLMKKKPIQNMHDIEEEIKSLEWKIQTTPLTLKEDKRLVERVRSLETQLLIHKQIQKFTDSLIELQAEGEVLEIKAKYYHEELSELAEQSREFHERMIEALKQAHALQIEADNAHQKYIETKEKAQVHHQKYTELMHQIRSLKQEIRKSEEERQAKRQLEISKQLEEKALEKLRRGEKLTWEEFRVLAERGIV